MNVLSDHILAPAAKHSIDYYKCLLSPWKLQHANFLAMFTLLKKVS